MLPTFVLHGASKVEDNSDDFVPIGKEIVCKQLRDCLRWFFPELITPGAEAVEAFVDESYYLADLTFGLEAAAEWGEGFVIPEMAVADDIRRFEQAGCSLAQLAETSRREKADQRLSRARVDAVISIANPHRTRLLELAEVGISIPVASDFTANGVWSRPPLRQKHLAAGRAVEKMIYEFRKKGLAVILPMSLMEKTFPLATQVESLSSNRVGGDLQFSPLSWHPKSASPQGRNINDCSDGGPRGMPLNSKEAKTATKAQWGEIVHPTLTDIVQMIDNFFVKAKGQDSAVRQKDLRLWKMDLSGAFTLLDFKPSDVRLMAAEMQDGLVVIFTCGVFGWTGLPAAFQVVNRSLVWELTQCGVLKGRVLMYTDDILGISFVKDLCDDLHTTRQLCTSLLGDMAVEDRKTEHGRRLTMLGWDLDLDSQKVTIARKNALKAFHGFATIDVTSKVSMKKIEALASWAQRYGEVCVYMRPFRRVLYSLIRRKLQHTSISLPPHAIQVIRLYRALFALTFLREDQFTRSMASFRAVQSSVMVEFDGSLEGVGVIWYRIYRTIHNGEPVALEVPVGGCAVNLRGFAFGIDSQFQNTSEFMGVVVGMFGLKVLGLDRTEVGLRGDSVTALTWAMKGNFKSNNALNTATVYTLLCAAHGITVVESIHISHDDNWRTDILSRRIPSSSWNETLSELEGRDSRMRDLAEISLDVRELLLLCDPRLIFESDEVFGGYWQRVRRAIDAS